MATNHGSRGGFMVSGTRSAASHLLVSNLEITDRVLSLGYAFLSANYQLLPPGTVHETIQDIQDLFIYLENNVISLGDKGAFRADMKRTAVAGSSAGGYCAYLAAVHCVPKPKAMFTMAAIGGSVFVSTLHVKDTEFLKSNQQVFAIVPPSSRLLTT